MMHTKELERVTADYDKLCTKLLEMQDVVEKMNGAIATSNRELAIKVAELEEVRLSLADVRELARAMERERNQAREQCAILESELAKLEHLVRGENDE